HRSPFPTRRSSDLIARPEDLAGYFRQLRAPTDEAITELLATGELREVEVDGVPALRWHRARTPRQVRARPLLAPFAPLAFFRPRIDRLFDSPYTTETDP